MNWIEYTIVRHSVQLHQLAAARPLTPEEQERLTICEGVIKRLDLANDPPPAPRRTREKPKPKPRWNTRW